MLEEDRREAKVKKTLVCAVVAGVILGLSPLAQATSVDLSLEPSTLTVNVGDSFLLELWMRSDPTGQSMDGADVYLVWDSSYVRLDGLVEDGDYDWMTVFFNDPIDDGDAELTLFAPFEGDRPQTDLHAVSLQFTALALTASTPISIEAQSPEGFSTAVAYEGEDITGSLSGTDLTIVPEPATLSVLALGGLALLLRRRKV
jgi:hypothetical protein